MQLEHPRTPVRTPRKPWRTPRFQEIELEVDGASRAPSSARRDVRRVSPVPQHEAMQEGVG